LLTLCPNSIRPLVTGDRRKRRLSGRDQISADGKRLIDGVAFGRPRLKTPRDRPDLDIPPLKRRRVTREALEEEDEEPRLLLTEHGEDDIPDRRVRLRARFAEPLHEGLEEDQEDQDGDFMEEDVDHNSEEGEEDPSSQDDYNNSDLENELLDLQADNEELHDEESRAREISTSLDDGAAELDLETLDKISALRAAFPTAQADACERALTRHGGDTKSAYSALQRKHQPRVALAAVLDTAPSTRQVTSTVNDDQDESEAESVASMVKHYDQHGFPSGSILAGTAAAQMAEALRKSGHPVKPPVHTKFDDAAEAKVDQHSSPRLGDREAAVEIADHSDPDSEAGSDSDSGNDSGPEVASSKLPDTPGGAKLRRVSVSESESSDESDSSNDSSDSDGKGDSDDTSSSDSDDGSDSDDEDDAAYEYNSAQGSDTHGSDDSSADSSSDDSDSSSDDGSDSSADEVGEAHTAHKALHVATLQPAPQPAVAPTPEAKSISGEPPRPVLPGHGKIATHKRNARRRSAHRWKAAALGLCSPPTKARRATMPHDSQDLATSIATKKAALLKNLNLEGETSLPAGVPDNEKQDASTPSRAPGVVPNIRPRLPQDPLAPPHVQDQSASHNPESWRDKIMYRAVECCQEGVELSEPPFPFVQRWDPQQQYFRGGNKRGGGSKRKQRDQDAFQEAGGRSNAKRRRHGAQDDYWEESYVSHNSANGYYDEMSLNYDEEVPLNYDDDIREKEAQVQQEEQSQHQPAHDMNNDVDDDDDLPPLPADTSTLPALNPSEALVGMVLTWKQWLLSKATSWQPQVSALTGVVIEVLDGNALTVRLAKRDRNIDRSEKTYDDDGNRVYDKFELPGMDEESEEAAEEGYRTLDLADMIEPRIVQAAPGAREPSHPSPQEAAEDPIQDDGVAPSDEGGFVTPDEATSEKNADEPAGLDVGTQSGGPESMISETQVAQPPVEASISEDRHREISLLINNAGFRKDLDPSVTTDLADNALDLSSPSRQLEQLDGSSVAPADLPEARGRSSSRLPSQLMSDNIDTQPILLEPFHGFSDPIVELQDEPSVRYPTLDLPSETGSLHSGRQVEPDFSVDLGHDSLPELGPAATVSRSTLGRHDGEEDDDGGDDDEAGDSDDEADDDEDDDDEGDDGREEEGDNEGDDDEEKGLEEDDEEQGDDGQDLASEGPDSHADSESDSSDASFPSLSEVWMSASATGHKPPSKGAVLSAIKARKSVVSPDTEYDETMRRLDESRVFEDEDESQLPLPAHSLVSKRTETATPKRLPHGKSAVKPSPTIKAECVPVASRTGSSPFVVPKGSQVVSLLSSSPERELEEHYAEDSIDDTYEGPSMPSGSGWVKKSRPRRGNPEPVSVAGRNVVSSSMPVTSASQSGWKQKGGRNQQQH